MCILLLPLSHFMAIFLFQCPKKNDPSIYDIYLRLLQPHFINYPHLVSTTFYVAKIKSSIHFLKTLLVKLAHTIWDGGSSIVQMHYFCFNKIGLLDLLCKNENGEPFIMNVHRCIPYMYIHISYQKVTV